MDEMEGQLFSDPESSELQKPLTTFNFTNHDFIAGFNITLKEWFEGARIPVVSVLLTSAFTLEDAQSEGMLFGRSLAYLITDTVSKLNAYYPTIGMREYDTEDSYCNAVGDATAKLDEWKTDERFYRLGWEDLVFAAFFGSVQRAFTATKGRRA
jgi:hypothetical protein